MDGDQGRRGSRRDRCAERVRPFASWRQLGIGLAVVGATIAVYFFRGAKSAAAVQPFDRANLPLDRRYREAYSEYDEHGPPADVFARRS